MNLFYFLHRVVMNINEGECEKYFACCMMFLLFLLAKRATIIWLFKGNFFFFFLRERLEVKRNQRLE